MPMTPTFMPPLSAPHCLSGVYIVMPEQKMGPAACREYVFGIWKTLIAFS